MGAIYVQWYRSACWPPWKLLVALWIPGPRTQPARLYERCGWMTSWWDKVWMCLFASTLLAHLSKSCHNNCRQTGALSQDSVAVIWLVIGADTHFYTPTPSKSGVSRVSTLAVENWRGSLFTHVSALLPLWCSSLNVPTLRVRLSPQRKSPGTSSW